MEYVIWGKRRTANEEELLLEQFDGLPITSREDAEMAAIVLRRKYGCRDVRIQEIDLTTPPVFPVGNTNKTTREEKQ